MQTGSWFPHFSGFASKTGATHSVERVPRGGSNSAATLPDTLASELTREHEKECESTEYWSGAGAAIAGASGLTCMYVCGTLGAWGY